jgi:hypothetical protein
MIGKRTLAGAAITAMSVTLAGCYQPVVPFDGSPYYGYYYGGVPLGGTVGYYQAYAAPWYVGAGHYGPDPGFAHPRYLRRRGVTQGGYVHY